MAHDAPEHIIEILPGIHLAGLARLHQAKEERGGPGPSLASGKEPVFPSDCDNTKNSPGKIVVNIEIAIFCVSIQGDPLPTGITYSLADGTLWQNFNRPIVQALSNTDTD